MKTIELSGIIFDPSLLLCKILVFCFGRCWGGLKVKTNVMSFSKSAFGPNLFLNKTNVFEPRGRWENFEVRGFFLTQVCSLAD